MFSESGLLYSCQDLDCPACQRDQELSYNIHLYLKNVLLEKITCIANCSCYSGSIEIKQTKVSSAVQAGLPCLPSAHAFGMLQ